MARKVRHSKLETRTARLKLAVRRKPYNGPSLARGVQLHYRRNRTNGTWVLKARDGHGKYWTKAFAEADDFDESNGKTILTFFEAQDTAKKLARGGGEADTTAPITVDRALADYRRDLISRGADRLQRRLPAPPSDRRVAVQAGALLTSRELKAWRDGLLGKIRARDRSTGSAMRSRGARTGGAARPAHPEPRCMGSRPCRAARTRRRRATSCCTDAKVHALVAAAYRHDPALGLLVDTLAMTGARPMPSRALARRGPARSPGEAEADDAEVRQGRRAEPEREESRTLRCRSRSRCRRS